MASTSITSTGLPSDTAAIIAAVVNDSSPPPNSNGNEPIPVTDLFWPSFLTALLMIILSELGDKTFLIAAIMAMRHSRVLVFSAALVALALMTVISAAFGLVLPNLIPKKYTLWMASILFIIFGMKMLIEGIQMNPQQIQEEYDEVSHEIEESEDITRRRARSIESARETNNSSCHNSVPPLLNCFYSLRVERLLSPVALQTFSLTFLAEWGDRSQIATIALAAAQNVYGVAAGAIAGHAICTALAVLGGRLLASVLSIRTVMIAGGFSFIIFAIFAIL